MTDGGGTRGQGLGLHGRSKAECCRYAPRVDRRDGAGDVRGWGAQERVIDGLWLAV